MEIYECQNCGFQDDESKFKEAKDLFERHAPGDTFSDIECPHCGALAFPIKEDTDQ